MTTPVSPFLSATTTRGLLSAGEGADEFFHPLLPIDLQASNGFLTILNGWNLNRRMADTVGYDGTAAKAVELLQIRAPRQPLIPAISMPGTGRVFGRGYFWRYRWRNSRTGEHSGLSPLPTYKVNLGTEQPTGGSGHIGQTAFFHIDISDVPAAADTLDLFRNTTTRADVMYLVESASVLGQTYVSITDDFTDDELFLREILSLDVPSGPTWPEGVMPPMVKAWLHASGRTFYSGIRRFGRRWFGTNACTGDVTQGSDLVTLGASSSQMRLVEPGRVGQRVLFYTTADLNDPITDPTVYRFVKAESEVTFRVTPELQVSGDLAADATASFYMVIEDDRDARWTYMSEPGKPWLIDFKKTVATGDDYDDGVMSWFSMGGQTFVQTKRRIYGVLDDYTTDPSRTMRFTLAASDGMVGFFAGCETPFGWVFVNERKGVRIFDGGLTRPLDRGATPMTSFLAETQFARFEKSMLEECRCIYDPVGHAVIVAYAPTGGSTLSEALYFSAGDGVWRGPYRLSVYAAGDMRTSSSENVLVIGDGYGNLYVLDEQVLDLVPSTAGTLTTTGTVTSAVLNRVFSDSTATFNSDSDERLRGCPIWFTNAAGTINYFSRIADVLGTTQLELDGPPVDEDGAAAYITVGWTYGIGSIRWEAITSYVDGGDPVFPKVADEIHFRFRRGTAATTFEVGCSEDANGTYVGQRLTASSSPIETTDVNGTIYDKVALQRAGVAFQLRFRGLSRTGDPQITAAIIAMDIQRGTP